MIKVSTSRDAQNGDYEAEDVLEIIRKGFEAGETEFSTPLSGYGNWKIMMTKLGWGDEYNRRFDSNWEFWARMDALSLVLISLAPGRNDPKFNKYTSPVVYGYDYDESTGMVTFKVKAGSDNHNDWGHEAVHDITALRLTIDPEFKKRYEEIEKKKQ